MASYLDQLIDEFAPTNKIQAGMTDSLQAPSSLSGIEQLQALANQKEELRKRQQSALSDYSALASKRPESRLLQENQTMGQFFKDPSEAQRAFMVNFGLKLAAGDSTKDLSSRLAEALGQGVGALQASRASDIKQQQIQDKSKIEQMALQQEGLSDQFTQRKAMLGEERAIAGAEREETRLGLEERRLATSEFQALPKVDQYQQLIDKAIKSQDYNSAARYQRLQEQELYGEPNKVAQINDQIDRLNTQLQSLDLNDPGYQQQRDRIQRRISDQESLKAKQTYISGGTTLNPDGSVTFGGPAKQQKTAQFDLDTVTGMTGRALVDLPSILVDPYFQSSTGPIAQAKFLPVVQLFGETGGKELRERIGLYSDERGVEKTEFFKPLSEKEWPIARRMLAINPKLPAAANINIQVKTHAPKGLEQIQNAYTRTQNDLYGIQARMSVAQQMAMPFINGHGQDPRNPFAGGLDISPEGANASTKDLDKFFPTADSSAKGQGYLVKTVNGQKRLFPQEYVQSIYNRQMNSSNPGDFIMLGGKRVTNIPYEFYVKNFGYSEY